MHKTLLFTFSLSLFTATFAQERMVFIGTSGLGHVSPAATVPFGLVQAGPDTSAVEHEFRGNWAHTCGYQFTDGWLWRFSQTHLMGTGCSSFGDFGLFPFTEGFDPLTHPAKLLKATERGEPGFYAVSFEENDATFAAEMTTAPHGAIYRFVYPKGTRAKLLVDLDWAIGWHAEKLSTWGLYIKDSFASFASDSTRVWGMHNLHSWTDYKLHFASRFSRPYLAKRCLREAGAGRGETWELDFGELPEGELFVTIALSYASVEAASRNLEAEFAACDRQTFDATRATSAASWRQALSTIELGADTPADVALNFKAALYRTFLQPNLISDAGQPTRYSTLSIWDTFRAAHPLYTFTAADRVPDFINSMLDCYDRQGYLPIWGLAGSDTHCMIGHHAVPVIVDWFLKNENSAVNWERAYRAVKDSLTRNHIAANIAGGGLLKEDFDLLDRYGYYPFDQLSCGLDRRPVKGEAVARQMECCYDDACAARLAEKLGKTDDAAFFARRAASWTNVYDRTSGFVRGRNAAGEWREPFKPYALGLGSARENDYCEGNAWQYTWHVLHDFDRLVELMGGKDAAKARLDGLFSARPPNAELDGVENDVTGCIGQYAHGNEPSHHIAYLYTLLGAPEKAAEVIRKVFATQYFPRPDGLCGNDDCGQMAAWYVFSALGFYPVDPCGGEYVVGAPQVPSAVIRLPNGKTLKVRAEQGAEKGVKAVSLNGRRFDDSFILQHHDLLVGGELVFSGCCATSSAVMPSTSTSQAKIAVDLSCDRADCRYGVGEACVFEVTGVLDTNRTLATSGSYEYLIDDFGTNILARGKIDFSQANPFRISSRVTAPGFQRLRVLKAYKLDRFGKPVQRARDWAVAAEPGKLVKGSVTPADFDAFWDKAKAEVEKVPLDPEMVRLDSRCTEAFDVYAVSFATLGKDRRVYGMLSIPKGETGRRFPLEVEVPGAGFGEYSQCFEPKEDRVYLKMGVFPWVPGRGLDKLDQRLNYENLQAACAARYGQSLGQRDAISYPLCGLDESPESAYFYPVVLGINRAVNWASALESVDRRHIWYRGTSQGGFFGIMLTALNGNFTRAVYFVPAGTDMLGNRQGRVDGWPYVSRCFAFDPVRQVRAEKHCAYFDAANFASRIRCPCRFVLGLADETCPPPCIYAAYNEVKASDKAIVMVPGMTHSVFEEVYLKADRWLHERARLTRSCRELHEGRKALN